MSSGSGRSKILVVDDQESNVRVLSMMLTELGFETASATNGEDALRSLSEYPADLILLDVFMPGIDGFEVCHRIHDLPDFTGVPIIFLSSADDKTFIVRALEAGGVDYVTKPFNFAELASRVRTHLALKLARDRLRQLAEDKDELLGILAHDLKNHLSGMQMSAQIMRTRVADLADTRLKQMSGNILHATEQMFSFVKEFLANTAADRGFTFKLEPVSLADGTAAAVQRYAEPALRKSLTFHEDYAKNAPLVLADRVALDQVIDNLVSNAVKFSPPGKAIWVSVGSSADGRGECRVRDQGPGCSEQDITNMFQRYRRLSARPTAGEPSTGLGLSIAKRHVNVMNGDLHCESAPEQGATFVVRLPKA